MSAGTIESLIHETVHDESDLGRSTWRRQHSLHWALRLGVAMCFVGHGAFGIITKPEWLPFFSTFGIGRDWAFRLMPVIGTVDIIAGLTMVLSPRPVVLLYMTLWGFWTALLRPISGDLAWETAERAGNYGVPLAFLLFTTRRDSLRTWLAPIVPVWPSPGRSLLIERVLRLTTAALLSGHGALAVFGKPLLAAHYAAVGLPIEALTVTGWFEIALTVAVLLRPRFALLIFVVTWKVATEALFPITGAPWWEFIERGGSYAAPLALAIIVHHRAAHPGEPT